MLVKFGGALCWLDFHFYNLQQRFGGYSRSFSFNGNWANTALVLDFIQCRACVFVFFRNVVMSRFWFAGCCCGCGGDGAGAFFQFLIILLKLFIFGDDSVTFIYKLLVILFQFYNFHILHVDGVLHLFHLLLLSVSGCLSSHSIFKLFTLKLFFLRQMIQFPFTANGGSTCFRGRAFGAGIVFQRLRDDKFWSHFSILLRLI